MRVDIVHTRQPSDIKFSQFEYVTMLDLLLILAPKGDSVSHFQACTTSLELLRSALHGGSYSPL